MAALGGFKVPYFFAFLPAFQKANWRQKSRRENVKGVTLPATHPAFRGASRTCTYVHNAVRILSRGIHMTSAL
jgi:hypothetical protein